MDLSDLVRALVGLDPLAVRQWIADASRSNVQWANLPRPEGLNLTEDVIAAGVAELLAFRAGVNPPAWTSAVGAAPEPVFLVRAALQMPRLRWSCEHEGPEPLRRRRVFAPPDFLTVA